MHQKASANTCTLPVYCRVYDNTTHERVRSYSRLKLKPTLMESENQLFSIFNFHRSEDLPHCNHQRKKCLVPAELAFGTSCLSHKPARATLLRAVTLSIMELMFSTFGGNV